MHRLTPALLVDTDAGGLEALGYGFQGEGWQPTLAPDYAGAPAAAARGDLKLAVVVVRDPVEPALATLRTLREGQATPMPILVLGPESIRAEVRALPAIDFLPLPAYQRDVLTAGKLLAATYEASGRAGATELELTASLSDYGLFYLIRTMIGLGRSGILQIERANRRGEIRFSEGEVTGATVGSLQGTPALHQLLLWEEAALDLKLRHTVHRGPFNQRPDDLIDEAERFLRDFNHASKDLGPMGRVLVADLEKATAANDTLASEVAPLVRLFDGQRTLGDVIEDSPFRVFDTLRIVARLTELGLLREKEIAASPPKPATPTLKIAPAPQGPAGAIAVAAPASLDAPDGSTRKAAVLPKDQRTGPSNRRKLQRRERGTLEQGTLNRTPAPQPVATSPETPADAENGARPSEVPGPASTSGALQASGTLGTARGELRAVDREKPQAAPTPSVVVDMGPESPAAVAPAAASPSAPSLQDVGVMHGRKTSEAPAAAPAAFSIEVDPALMAEMAEHEKASATPPPVVVVPPEPAKAKEPAPVVPAPAHPAPEPRNNTGRRPSSEFNALESDFFAREADLYKQEHPETFDDLEHGRGPNGPNRSR
jgi:ActR/RegA family two-component response regulator